MNATNVADLVAALRTFEHGKVVSAREAVALIRSGNTVATSGFVGIGFAENIAVEARGLEDIVLGGAGFLEDAKLALAS